MVQEQNKTDRYASGSGRTEDDDASREDDLRPGEIGGGATYLPESGRATEAAGAGASSAEGTIGAVGEMDLTGAPAGATAASPISGGGSSAGNSLGGGTGGGAMSSGGTGPGSVHSEPQSIESTTAILQDNEPSTTAET